MNNALRLALAAVAFVAFASGAQAATGHAAMSVGVTVVAATCTASTTQGNGQDTMCSASVVSHAAAIEAVNARAASVIAAAGADDVVEYDY